VKTPEELRLEAEHNATMAKQLFLSPDGKKVFDLLVTEFADRVSHVPGDPYTSAFNEGQRSVVLFLMDLMEQEYER